MSATNRCVVYKGPGQVAVEEIPWPKLEHPVTKRKLLHAVVLETVATNICGSDQHMVRGRTTAELGQTLGHEITGIVREVGEGVEWLKVGDVVSVPFNIACGTCARCCERQTGICLNVNPARPGAAYGYVDMGGWVGGQANAVMIPWADFNCLKLADDFDEVRLAILDLALLSDILPTGYHGAISAGVGPGKSVYIAGAGPVGLACATACKLLGASHVFVGDLIRERLEQAEWFGCIPINVAEADIRDEFNDHCGSPEVDCGVDCVGFEARGHGSDAGKEAPATVLNALMSNVRAGGKLGIPGLYVTGDPGGVDDAAKVGSLSIRLGLGWAKSQQFMTGQCPVKLYNRELMAAIKADLIAPADNVNVKVISLDEAPNGYVDFDRGAAVKYIIDANGHLSS